LRAFRWDLESAHEPSQAQTFSGPSIEKAHDPLRSRDAHVVALVILDRATDGNNRPWQHIRQSPSAPRAASRAVISRRIVFADGQIVATERRRIRFIHRISGVLISM
jgi:hypothetical protein